MSLKAWDSNPRNIEAAVDKVAASIERFGFGAPLVVREQDGRIVGGHTRWFAARKLGLATVPARFMALSEADADALALADNKLGEIATWDDDQLARIVEDLQSRKGGDETLDVAGFTDLEVRRILAGLGEDAPAGEPTAEDEGVGGERPAVRCPKCKHEFVP